MKRLLTLLLIPASACTGGERANNGQCPAGEVCSPDTPNGLHFIGNQLADSLNLAGPSPTAIGGSQEIALQYDRGDGILIALDLPWKADDDGGAGVAVSATSGSIVTVRGAGSRQNYLRITDEAGNLYDRKMLAGAALDTIELLPTTLERIPPHSDLAWAPGTFDIAVALYGQVQESGGPTEERLVDSSMTLALTGAQKTAWDTLHLANAQTGTSTLMVTAGDKPAAAIDIVIIATADTVGPIDSPASLMTNVSADVCFSATTGSRTLVGLPWTFTVDGAAQPASLEPNCVAVKTTKTTGTVSIVGTAGGKSATLQLAVGAMARQAPRTVHAVRWLSTAGERASM
jgi:hypothetical protein